MKSIYEIRRLNLSDMIDSEKYESFISDRLGNDLFINDPERADRIYEYAENGCNGSTHREAIEDYSAFLNSIRRDIPERVFNRIEAEIEALQLWHEQNGSINTIIN